MSPWDKFKDKIASPLAFFPPEPPTYRVDQHSDATGELYIQPTMPDLPRIASGLVKRVVTVPTRTGRLGGGSDIVTAFVPYRVHGGGIAPVTVLYSHGNAVDLGQMLPVYKEFSRLFKVNVMGYDYSGYGQSTGQPAVSSTLSDIQAVWDLLLSEYGCAPQSIVLYGQSVGSGPSTWLAAQEQDVGGVVLHSPLLSGLRVLKPDLNWWPSWFDVFPNHVWITKVAAPTLIMHGDLDEVVHISCGKRLHSLAKNPYPPLWDPACNHQNLEMSPEYVPTVAKFVAHVAAQLKVAQQARAVASNKRAVP